MGQSLEEFNAKAVGVPRQTTQGIANRVHRNHEIKRVVIPALRERQAAKTVRS